VLVPVTTATSWVDMGAFRESELTSPTLAPNTYRMIVRTKRLA
jgi:hypothetical protein